MKTNNKNMLQAKFSRRWRLNQLGGVRCRLSRWRVLPWLVLQRLGQHWWVKTPVFWGERMHVLTGETVSRGLLAFGYTETALTALMLVAIKPGMRCIDVGAHLGYESLLASVLVGLAGRVISIEPQEQIAVWTERNLRNFPQARVVRMAAGEKNGSMAIAEYDLIFSAFSGPAQGFSGPAQVPNQVKIRQVPVAALNDIVCSDERPIDFIKCDVEGGELAVLRGAIEFLKEDRPLVVLEVGMPRESRTQARMREFEDYLGPLGYEMVMFEYDGSLKFGRSGEFRVGHANVVFVHPSRRDFQYFLST